LDTPLPQARALRVQKAKLDRLSAALRSPRLARELAAGEEVTSEMLKLLHVSSRLRAQLASQQEAAPGRRLPHLTEHDARGGGGGGGGGGTGGGAGPQRLEVSLLRSKVMSLEEDLGRFQALLSADRAFDAEEARAAPHRTRAPRPAAAARRAARPAAERRPSSPRSAASHRPPTAPPRRRAAAPPRLLRAARGRNSLLLG